MPISLYDATIRTFLQVLTGVDGFMAKAETAFLASGQDLGEIVETRLAPDMLPLRFQIESAAHQSVGAVAGVREGRFQPRASDPGLGWPDLRALVTEARSELELLDEAAVEAWIGREVRFEGRGLALSFTAEGFLMSFSLPNLLFHAATAYDILRMRGAPLGKRDFIGPLRLAS